MATLNENSKKAGNQLVSLPNIGKDLSQKLLTLGIDTPEKLKQTGTEQTYLRIKALDPGACFSLLCAIEGAIRGIRWHNLPPERKQELKQFFHMAKKNTCS
ncbi:MAG TPA: TfoX/Sxy family protein [Bacteroidales bacterium]